MKNIGKGSACGKVILIGEHSVVYGQPAISMPFLASMTEVIIERVDGDVEIACDFYKGKLENVGENLLGPKTIIEQIVSDLGQDLANFSISIGTSIPVERGMGSSAAVAVALTRAIFDYFNEDLTKETLIKYGNMSEKIVHGNPSGIDVATIVGEKPLYFIKGLDFQPFDFNLDGYLIVADSGQVGNTKKAVEDVRDRLDKNFEENNRLIKDLGRLTDESKVYMEENMVKKLGLNMNKAQENLYKLGVSNTRLESLVARARQEGALGAKLTGGGQGGSMIALAGDRLLAEKLAAGLLDEGARETWISNLGEVFDE